MKRTSSLFLILSLFYLIACSNSEPGVYPDSKNGHPHEVKFKVEPHSTVLVLGDSISDPTLYSKGWVKWFAEDLDLKVLNLAEGGSRYNLYVKNVREVNLNLFDYVFIMGGVNDIYKGTEINYLLGELDFVCSKLEGKKGVIINPFSSDYLISSMPESSSYSFREEIYRQAKKHGFTYINALEFKYETSDGLHPTETGCSQISHCMKVALGVE